MVALHDIVEQYWELPTLSVLNRVRKCHFENHFYCVFVKMLMKHIGTFLKIGLANDRPDGDCALYSCIIPSVAHAL